MPLNIKKNRDSLRLRVLTCTIAIVCGVAVLVPSTSVAQDQKDQHAFDRLAGLERCRELSDSTSRLACFDQESARLVEATSTGEFQIVDRQEVQKTRRGLFGFSLPKLGIFAGTSGDDLEKSMQTEITSLRRIDADSWIMTVAEGSVWRISDAHRGFKPRVGAPVELERAAMGSYWVRVDGQIGVKGRRIE